MEVEFQIGCHLQIAVSQRQETRQSEAPEYQLVWSLLSTHDHCETLNGKFEIWMCAEEASGSLECRVQMLKTVVVWNTIPLLEIKAEIDWV